ncbi:MAG: Holliday junction resolvase RuvX [Planctomycetota bacterium]|jgi:putative Holliday junction resolvase|nr:Holliday junction resolvase RuvX [Planctomycetota bacterium]|tara:strand:- start:514 stop:954 length:441 start_codon:yes stop_codon:yes gene_type:complete
MSSVCYPGRLLGIDYGTRRIGIALSDPRQLIATPLTTYYRTRPEKEAPFFCNLADEYEIAGFVIGLPLHMHGEISDMAVEAKAFGSWLHKQTEKKIAFWDERLTTASAEIHLKAARMSLEKRKKKRDPVAAQIMLQSYLQSKSMDS